MLQSKQSKTKGIDPRLDFTDDSAPMRKKDGRLEVTHDSDEVVVWTQEDSETANIIFAERTAMRDKWREILHEVAGEIQIKSHVQQRLHSRAMYSHERHDIAEKWLDTNNNFPSKPKVERLLQEADIIALNIMELRSRLAARHRGLVGIILKEYVGSEHLEDIRAEAWTWLIYSAERFDIRKEFQFSTYAIPVMRDRVKKYLRKQRRHTAISLHSPVGKHDDRKMEDIVQDMEAPVAEENVCDTERKNAVREALTHLSDRDKEIVELRWGLSDGIERDYPAIAKIMGMSREMAKRRYLYALRVLRNKLNGKNI